MQNSGKKSKGTGAYNKGSNSPYFRKRGFGSNSSVHKLPKELKKFGKIKGELV